ncbi:MAG: hypothetical protein EBW15_08250 [Actinobacteria bacterium]|nr:hypothetical protein [Actinomycetota bacterium]
MMIAFIIRRLGVLFLILFGSSFILYNLTAITGEFYSLQLNSDHRRSNRRSSLQQRSRSASPD